MPFDETATLELSRSAEPTSAAHPSGLEARVDRRGPLRPKVLAPTRLRLAGQQMTLGFMFGDTVTLLLAGGVTCVELGASLANLSVTVGCALAVMATLWNLQTYAFPARYGLLAQLTKVTLAFVVGATLGALALLFVATPLAVAAALQIWAPLAWVMIATMHTVWWLTVQRWRVSGRLTPNIVVVGATGAAERLISAMLAKPDVNILGLFDDRAGRSPPNIVGVPVLGDTKALLDHRIMPFVDRVVISVPSAAQVRVAQLIERLRVLPNEITLLLDGESKDYEAAAIGRIADVPLALISGAPGNQARAMMKRGQDIIVGTTALLFALPIMVVVAFAIRLDSPGPILFRQRRHGFNNEEIVVWKFRSMKIERTDARATRQISANDDRVTRVGRIIRRTSLDELPQIFNVLSGQMSLVGPRPHAIGMMTGDVESARLVAEYAHRHRMKPGMTGWAAIHGSRGPVDTPELVHQRVAYDVEYIQRQSFWLDMWIMLVTIPCLLGDSEAVR